MLWSPWGGVGGMHPRQEASVAEVGHRVALGGAAVGCRTDFDEGTTTSPPSPLRIFPSANRARWSGCGGPGGRQPGCRRVASPVKGGHRG